MRASSWNQISSGLSVAAAVVARRVGTFFDRRDSRLVMLVMTGPRRELSIAQSAQLAAQDLFGHRQAVFVEHPLRQIDQSPANDLMNRRGRTGFDHGDER